MNEVEKRYFDALHKDRSDSADTFEKPSTREMWRSIVEKYSDQAHFIYELIQNADDVGATSTRFILESDKLIFAHNGKRHFSISNPETEDKDSKEGNLGDINAITGIAFSNKKTQENKIGKFGVGFKAVFQYTATPHIYDPDFRFCINRYIVPIALEADFPDRRPDETLFVFPFDHKDRNPVETYKDIEGKLKDLSYPILFLTNLLDISFEIGNLIGFYRKNIEETYEFEDTIAEKICLMQKSGKSITYKYLWLFSRFDGDFKYSVGFFLDENNYLTPANEPAFCFFPTKETTGLNFLVHAPFLLTDSREGIRVGIAHNNNLINMLSVLAADSMLYLRDIGERTSVQLITDDIFSIIPIKEDAFCDVDDTSCISFKPFYSAIKNVFETEELIPTRDGYTCVENAYWAAVPFLAQLFDDAQLADICENSDAKWAFLSHGRDEVQRNNKALFSYIESITKTGLTEDALINGRSASLYGTRIKAIKGIDNSFIEKQDVSWLHKLYKWLSETSHRTELAKKKPIFLDQDSKAVAAFDKNNQQVLFLPIDDNENYIVVNDELLQNKDTYEFIQKIGLTKPSLKDEIYNLILPQYNTDKPIVTKPHFKKFFSYYQKCTQRDSVAFINMIKDLAFTLCKYNDDETLYRCKVCDSYYPDKSLERWFKTKPRTLFLAFEEYIKVFGEDKKEELLEFLNALGLKNIPSLKENSGSGYYEREIENYIDGFQEIINECIIKKDIELSSFIWEELCVFIENGLLNRKILIKQVLSRSDGRCNFTSTYIESNTAKLLRVQPWLVNKNGEFVSADKLSKNSLSEIYNMKSDQLVELLDLLGIEDEVEREDYSMLSDNQLRQIERAKLCDELGLTMEDLKEMAEIKSRRKAHASAISSHTDDSRSITYEEIDEKIFADTEYGHNVGTDVQPKKKLNHAAVRVAKDIIKKTNPIPTAYVDTPLDEQEDIDEDEFIPSSVNYSRKVELEKQKAAKAIDKIAYQEELQQRALDAPRYSYGWFKALLELETLNTNTNNLNSKEVSISFASVEREVGTQRTLILKQPNRYIPQFMEDLADIPLVLSIGGQTKTLAIEVANIKSYTLRVKLKSHVEIQELDLSKVTEARIDAKSPVFLLEELRKQFIELGYVDDYNMQENLCENIEFVFGPPGTGKTTHLAKNVLVPLMFSKQNLNVLVLTPTNKAADVLVRRIMEVMDKDLSYNDWLVRFGGTGDELIEQSPVYRDKTFDIRTLNKNVTVTTIARFPYDFFMPQGSRIFLNGINWDYIIIDEASMIPLVNIVYPLYKKTPKKFIIAGDPFQIEPITSVDLWKNENIYTMVHLDSFVDPKTIPYDYKVELLTTQYRSIPSVGSVFSKFAYGGILEHYRGEDSKKKLNIDDKLKVNALNIIKFPVSKYESIYRSKRLQHSSSYQIYSALFTFEFVSYLSNLIANANCGDLFKIGIIAPYRAQADLIEKLIGSAEIPKEIDVQVGTIHGFQGDECDIIFAVFNTPPTITGGKDMFLNKSNIINVSISRAKDYLFVVMPDDNVENIGNLHLVKRVEQLFKSSGSYVEFQTHDLEQHIFGNAQYLEENAFSTGHQSVNVYRLPEKCYEIRSEDTAVDVQIYRPIEQRNQEKTE
ncbi:ATP-binding protein [Clostridium sp. BSD9I1]|uniref:DEAD/DEAH box helicase n=1 Tax=Clostridium sp. BSD9I1 TaxID=2003589 RepID=UPI00164852C4|nr:AAA domain-containing protein [Clostridium sp. BSD9I1]